MSFLTIRVPKPKGERRARVATTEDLLAIKQVASEELWRIMMVALNTGLRIGRIFAIEYEWIQHSQEGWWLVMPEPQSKLKKHPPKVPLNRLAFSALHLDPTHEQSGRVWSWHNIRSLKKAWSLACQKVTIHDLHFHDLRHTAATRLQGLGVGYEVRQALLGHAMKGETANYCHGSDGWDRQLREAVSRLDKAYRQEQVVYEVVYEPVDGTTVIGLYDYKELKTKGKFGAGKGI